MDDQAENRNEATEKPPLNEARVRIFRHPSGSDGFNSHAVELAAWPMRVWLQWQAGVLNVAAPATADWFKRRREGTVAALHVLERLASCQDGLDASKVQREWIEDETQRLQEDWQAAVSVNQAFLWSQDKVTARSEAA